MAQLSLDIEHDPDMWGDGTHAVFFTMLVDGTPVDDTSVDPEVFFDAVFCEGRHPLLMCPTGEFDCCGSWAKTTPSDEGLAISLTGEHGKVDVVLSWESVITAGEAMLDAIQRSREDNGVDPYVPSKVDVNDRIPHYRMELARLAEERGSHSR